MTDYMCGRTTNFLGLKQEPAVEATEVAAEAVAAMVAVVALVAAAAESAGASKSPLGTLPFITSQEFPEFQISHAIYRCHSNKLYTLNICSLSHLSHQQGRYRLNNSSIQDLGGLRRYKSSK